MANGASQDVITNAATGLLTTGMNGAVNSAKVSGDAGVAVSAVASSALSALQAVNTGQDAGTAAILGAIKPLASAVGRFPKKYA